jgi:energy-coupling factor transporter ATP-binding protein EcfA2
MTISRHAISPEGLASHRLSKIRGEPVRSPYDRHVTDTNFSGAARSSPLMSWSVPAPHAAATILSAIAGEALTIVGANGSGKSALAGWLVLQTPQGKVKRLIAHRRLWFTSSGPDINAADRERQGQYVESWDRGSDSRYNDHLDGRRASIALFDLLGLINDQNRKSVDLYDAGRSSEQVLLATGERILPKLNRILSNASLHVSISVTSSQTFVAQHTSLGIEYPIFQMSDGEKAALLLATEVLTAPGDQIIVIDEPERHLHRSISAGLVDALIGERPDCAFVVITHDLDLATELAQKGRSFALTRCEWSQDSVSSWELNEITEDDGISEIARRAILGGRKKLMFIEGDLGSTDISLYQLLYPEWTCSPAGGCDSVIRAVTGLRASGQYHWADAVGIVDGDGRSEPEREALSRRGVLALPVNEVESLYYLESVLEVVAVAQSNVIGEEPQRLVQAARSALLTSMKPEHLQHFARKLALDEVHRKVVDHIPTTITAEDLEFRVPSRYEEILSTLDTMLGNQDYDGIVRSVSIRDSPACNAVARAMKFNSAAIFEQAARKQMLAHADLKRTAIDTIGTLPL